MRGRRDGLRDGAGAEVAPCEPGHVPRDAVTRAATNLDELGAEAVMAADADARADLLGKIWTVCADCHAQAGIR